MVISEAELIDAVARDRAAGRTIAFANGCFDLLHVGHVRYLQGAAAEADRLIVAVNDDRSVARLEGAGPSDPAGRPTARSSSPRSAASTTSCVFGDATVERLLLLLKPDVHCKGTDYTVESVPERAVVAGYGGRTAIVGDPEDTTRPRDPRSRRADGSRPGVDDQDVAVTRFLIVRLGALGDIVHAIPVAAALRRAFPAARIDWLVSAKHREILDLVPVDRSPPDRQRSRRRRRAGMSLLAAIRELRRRALRRRDRSAGADQVGAARARVGRRARRRLRRAATRASAGAAVLHRRVRSRRAAACTIRARRAMSSPSTSAC